jgi:hypothetical protein
MTTRSEARVIERGPSLGRQTDTYRVGDSEYLVIVTRAFNVLDVRSGALEGSRSTSTSRRRGRHDPTRHAPTTGP